jgi:hypothetical protein
MDLNAEIRSAEYLNSVSNWRKEQYLMQFNGQVEAELKKALSHLPDSNLKIKELKSFWAKCVICHRKFLSNGACEDAGICDVCSHHHYNEMKSINLSQSTLMTKESYGRKVLKKHYPTFLTNEKIQEISQFFFDNFYIKRNYLFKGDMLATVNKKFKTNLTKEQFLSLTPKPALIRRGFNFNFL